MKSKSLCLIIVFVICFVSCKKQTPKPVNGLPQATHIGANVVAWLTDSIPYICRASRMCNLYDDTIKTDPYPNTGNFQIQTPFIDNGGYHRALTLFSPQITSIPIQAGTTFLVPSNCSLYLHENIDPATNDATLYEVPGYTGQMTITYFDPVNKIISGTFSFTTVSTPPPARTVSGWFDLVYYTN
jgi:hypothetical protein